MNVKCNFDCFNCPYEDCLNDSNLIDDASLKIESYAEELKARENGKYDKMYLYNHSEKGRERFRKYNNSDKGRKTHNRYNHSENGIAARSRYEKKRLELEWLERYERLYCGRNSKYKNTTARQCKAYRIRKKYGIEVG